MFDNWEDFGSNMVLERTDFYLSYNPNTGDFGPDLDFLAGIFGVDLGEDREETAIMFNNGDGNQYILNGDHRAALEALGDDPKAVVKYYRDHPESHSEFTVEVHYDA